MKRSLVMILVLMVALVSLNSEVVRVGTTDNDVKLIESNSNQTILEMELGYFNKNHVIINGQEFNTLDLAKEGKTYETGAPEVPTMTRSIIIDNSSKPEMRIIESEYTEIELAVAPSKGVITRDIDPATVPYTFGTEYNNDEFYPSNIATLGDAYIMRSVRGVAVRFNPIQYNPASGVLRVYTSIKVAVANSNVTGENVLTRAAKNVESFDFIYKNHFLNYDENRYAPLNEIGSILVIAPANYHATMQDYVDWKIQKGIPTEMVDVATIGNSTTNIKNYIQDYYDNHDDFAFVQIAGDASQVATLSVSGGGSDPSYSLVAGNDSYPDIFIGRFSAETTAQLATQVERTIAYERDINTTATYLNKATGIASSQGGGSQGDMGESDITHMNLIRDDLLGYNYVSVDQIYDPSASASQVATVVNQGRGFMNYVGHGSDDSWVTSGFSSSHVNNLTNVDMLPFIVSVACVNGNFVSQTCFGEAWLRATHNGDPTGAMAIYASTINQSWDSPMRGEDEITDLLVSEELSSIGGLYYSGSCEMIDAYNADGIEMFKTWHIFGDASLQVRTDVPTEMTVSHTGILFIGMNEYSINAGVANALVSVTYNNEILGSGYTDASGNIDLMLENLPVNVVDLNLTITALNKVTYNGIISITAAEGAYVVVDEYNPEIMYNHDGSYTLNIKNVGVETSSNLTATLTTDDANVTIIDGSEDIASVNADEIVSLPADAFNFTLANYPENGQTIEFNVNISNASDEWNYPVNLTVQAPQLSIEEITAEEVDGNGNGRMDAGETFEITVPVQNYANVPAGETQVELTFPLGSVAVAENIITETEILQNNYNLVTFTAVLSSQIPAGTQVDFSAQATFEGYTATGEYTDFVGLSVEGFETQSLDGFGWETTGGTYSFSTDAYEGTYSLQSAEIANSATTTLSVDYESSIDGEISFFMKVSTEANYDYVKFYIDNVEKVELSGAVNWAEYSYNVAAGEHTYKWEYSKDYMVASNDDCFYLDLVTFPASGGGATGNPEIAIDVTDYDFGMIQVIPEEDTSVSLDLVIENTGDGMSLGTIEIPAPFYARNDNEELVNSKSFTVDAGSTTTIELVFAPTTVDVFNEVATVTTDDVDNPTFELALAGESIGTPNAGNDLVPAVTSLEGNYPNPFNPETTIKYGLNKGGKVRIDIYNLLGQKVKTLVNEDQSAGYHSVVWNGKDNNNRNVASGVYFYKMKSVGYNKTAKMILMK